MSKLGWIDFSSDERAKVKMVLAALNEPGTLDELGIGQIRDAFANRLFPGISTIQTRAKYFVTIARLLRDIQMGHANKSKSPQQWLENQEHELAKQLVLTSQGLEVGVIGAESIEQGGVSRRPSSIYWNGLKTFGIVHTPLSLKEFCSSLAESSHIAHAANHSHQEGTDDDDVDRMVRLIDLPSYENNWQADSQLNIHLSANEAKFLQDKLMTAIASEHSVPAQILRIGGVTKLLNAYEDNDLKTSKEISFDVMTALLLRHQAVSESCKALLAQAQTFSLAMEGPHIAYNYRLAEINGLEGLAQRLETQFAEWLVVVQQGDIFHPHCADNWFSALADNRIKPRSRRFVERFCLLMQQQASFFQIVALSDERARENKGKRSLLSKKRNSEKWAGMRRLDYRWSIARQLLSDIDDGLSGESHVKR
tara:strand:- start:17877 stop:19145 length:1269 start_codon:yes stop_codon:yes gene_type:complete